MSVRVDTTSWIAGAVLCGNRGLGVTGATIASETATGDSGPGLIFPSLDGAGDDAKEYCIRIKTAPSSGTLFVYENGQFTLTSAADGYYTIVADLYEDGVVLGEITFPITIGSLAQLIKDANATYYIRNFIQKDLVESFIIRNFYLNSLSQTYTIRGSVIDSMVNSYLIRNILTKDMVSNYNVRAILTNSFGATYFIRNILSQSLICTFIINGQTFIVHDLQGAYEILQKVGSNDIVIILQSNEPITLYVK